MKPRIAITLGDPAGVGPEVVAKALEHPRLPQANYLLVGNTDGHTPGKLTPQSARAAFTALETAVRMCLQGEADALVTAPVHKANLAKIGFNYAGQTEFLAARCGVPEEQAVMLMTDPRLSVALLTTHCALNEVIAKITPQHLDHVVRVTHQHFLRLGIAQPQLALAAINPHAGEGGRFGNEEKTLLTPAVSRLRKRGIHVSGPHSADTVYHRAVQGEFHAVIAPYHDQGLAPFKLVAFTTGVNLTLGLPIIRTSPDHGVAADIAGRGIADARSMLEAIRLACRLVKTRGLTSR